ncbi:MAG: isochorismatase family protein, partial [Hydrogenothermaceae bacterium]
MKLKITKKDALIVVDMQNDFMPYGVLPVKDADLIVPVINHYVDIFSKVAQPVFFTRDWHPENHISFKGFGGIWPPHCVADTEGSKFHPDLKIPEDNKFIVSKGTSRDFDAY